MAESDFRHNLATMLGNSEAALPFLSRLLPKPGEVRPWASPSAVFPPTEDTLQLSQHNLEAHNPMPTFLNAKRPLSPLTPFYPIRLGEHATPRRPEPVPVLHRPCAQCRAAKVKCNREAKCSRCVKLGIVCKLPPSPQHRRPRASSSSTIVISEEEGGVPSMKRPRAASNDFNNGLFAPLNVLEVDLNHVLNPSSLETSPSSPFL